MLDWHFDVRRTASCKLAYFIREKLIEDNKGFYKGIYLLVKLLQYEGKNLTDKINEWWSFSTFSTWNVMDLTALVLAVSAFSLRHFLQTFAIARLIFSLNFIVFISRSFKVYFVNSYLGPKVVMIKRMVRQTLHENQDK